MQSPTLAITEAASDVDRETGLRPALEARVVELEGDRIRFTHPLLAAGANETADPDRRSRVHARLAELLDDPEARAWRLAASSGAPDEVVADALEQAADVRRAEARLPTPSNPEFIWEAFLGIYCAIWGFRRYSPIVRPNWRGDAVA